MSYSIEDQINALLTAHQRHQLERTHAESRAGIAHASEDREYMRGIGLIPQNEARRSTPNREPRLRYSDPAYALEHGTLAGTSNVIVYYPDSTREIRTRSSFKAQRAANRAARKATTAQASSAPQAYVAPLISRMPAIGNID